MANEDDDGEKSRGTPQQIGNKPKTQIVIGVPSYQEVVESSQTKSTPPSLFKPSQTFSQAFAFVKSSDVYSAPPPLTSSSGASHVPSTRYFEYLMNEYYLRKEQNVDIVAYCRLIVR